MFKDIWYILKLIIMRKIIFSSIILVSFSTFAQQQQIGNIFLVNNSNPPAQAFQGNLINTSNINDDNNLGNIMLQQSNVNEANQNYVQSKQLNNKTNQSQSINSSGSNFNMSFSRSSAVSSSGAKVHKHTFSKKLKKIERHFYGKIIGHKKSKHRVDVCFNWSK